MKSEQRIIRNAIECAHCGWVLESRSRHEFVPHTCPKLGDRMIACDGGRAYLKRVGDKGDWIERAEFSASGGQS